MLDRFRDRFRKRRQPMPTVDRVDKELKKRERKQKRRDRREFFAKLLGIFGGQLFGTSKIGLVIAVAIGAASLAAIWKFLL